MNNNPFSLENKTILVTGASSGIGKQIALQIANMGGKATSAKLILAGMAVSAVCSAFSNFVISFSTIT